MSVKYEDIITKMEATIIMQAMQIKHQAEEIAALKRAMKRQMSDMQRVR